MISRKVFLARVNILREKREYLLLDMREFFIGCFFLLCRRMDVWCTICRNEVVVTMWYFISYKKSAYPFTSCGLLDWRREFLCSLKYSRVVWFWHIDEIIYFAFWNNECMSGGFGKYVEKRIYIFIFIDFIWWYFAFDDLGKEGRHSFLEGSSEKMLISANKIFDALWFLSF